MRVVYSNIINDILKIQEQADLDGRKIKHIAISKTEFDEIVSRLYPFGSCGRPSWRTDGIIGYVYGIPLVSIQYDGELELCSQQN